MSWCPLSRVTRKRVSGNTSLTIPIMSINSSLAMRFLCSDVVRPRRTGRRHVVPWNAGRREKAIWAMAGGGAGRAARSARGFAHSGFYPLPSAPLGKLDLDLENVQIVLTLELHLDVVGIDADVFADH